MSQQPHAGTRTNVSDESAAANSDSAFGLGMFPEDGPFMRGVHQTRWVLWLSVLLMVLGVGSLGVFVVSLHYAGSLLGWVSLVAGLVLVLAGAVLGSRNRILQDVT